MSPTVAEMEGGEAASKLARVLPSSFFCVFVNSNKDGQSVVSLEDRGPQQHGIGLTFLVCVLISVV